MVYRLNFTKTKKKKLDKKFEVVNKKVTFNLAHAEAIEATIGAELTKRVELLKTMNYHDWIQYNQKKYYHRFSKRNISYSSLEKGSKL